VSRLPRALVALVCLLLVTTAELGAAGPAQASSTLLCKGYTGCANLAMSNAGYQAASGTMWWRMYAGHNCTNYAAYRMVLSGLPNTRPWSGSGNASNWGHAEAALTNSVPTVGAVAWWDAYVRPAGSAGHVAYVEQVVSADEIVVSQDSWGGDFSWARITRVGGSWPSGFIHFNDAVLKNTVAPTVTGTAKVGATLTASAGAWTPAGPVIGYQWQADGVPIAGATAATVKLGLAQQGKRISVLVTASKVGYRTASASSLPSVAVAPGAITNPAPPTVTGDPVVGASLTAQPGTWTPTPSTLSYAWLADGVPVTGATSATLALDPALMGKTLAVRVTASKPGYAVASATSAPTTPVRPATFVTTGPPTVTGLPRPGQTLTAHPSGYSPSDATLGYQWLRAGIPVAGATGPTYRVGTADLGSRIRVRTTLAKPGWTTLAARSGPTAAVRSLAVLRVTTRQPARGRLTFTAGVTANGVTPVSGTVQVSSPGRAPLSGVLRGGVATLSVSRLPAGPRTFRFRYTGSPVVAAASTTRAVTVR
jgi:surface antigen